MSLPATLFGEGTTLVSQEGPDVLPVAEAGDVVEDAADHEDDETDPSEAVAEHQRRHREEERERRGLPDAPDLGPAEAASREEEERPGQHDVPKEDRDAEGERKDVRGNHGESRDHRAHAVPRFPGATSTWPSSWTR